jgi:hypothetical protein
MSRTNNAFVSNAITPPPGLGGEFRTAGPEIAGNVTFTKDHYANKVSNAKEIQGYQLPAEWLLEARSGWRRVTLVTLGGGIIGIVLAVVPSFIRLLHILFEHLPQDYRIVDRLNHAFTYLDGNFLVNTAVLIILSTASVVVAIVLTKKVWTFVGQNIFRNASREKQIWTGGGTTAVGVGDFGLSIKTMRAIFALDWTAAESCEVIERYVTMPSGLFRWRTGGKESAIRIVLRNVGENSGQCRDVLLIPSRFFDDQSQISWKKFVEEVKGKIPK